MTIDTTPRRVPATKPASRVAACLLVGGLLLLSGAARPAAAQRAAPATGSPMRNASAHPTTDDLEEQAAARVAAAVCGKRVVLLGELPEHGEGRGMEVKARVVRHLVDRCGFGAVLFEAGSYDFIGLERAIAATPRAPADSLELALARAIGGLWWTRELAELRRWLVQEAVAGRVAIGGIDDQLSATAAWAKATLPGLVGTTVPPARATECRDAVARYVSWGYTAAVPYDAAEQARLADCARLAADRAPNDVVLGDLASFFARERGAAGAPDRDLVMARHVDRWSARLPRDAKIVVWTATTHAARASGAHAVMPQGVPPLGARLAERWGDQLAVIGFTALRGEWSRAGSPSQPLAALPPNALEARALAGAAAGDAAGWVYLDRAALRSLGAAPSRLFGKETTTDWSAAFDGVLVLRDETAPTFEPRR